MSSGGVNVIRKITRGIAGARTGNRASIDCTITNTDKVVVILNGLLSAGTTTQYLYLDSVSTTKIEVSCSDNTTFSYQIIEFM